MQTEFTMSEDDFLALFTVEIDRAIDGACEFLEAVFLAQGGNDENVSSQNGSGSFVSTDRSALRFRSAA